MYLIMPYLSPENYRPEHLALQQVREIKPSEYEKERETRLDGFRLQSLSTVEIFYVNKDTFCQGEALIDEIHPGKAVYVDYTIKIHGRIFLASQEFDAENYLRSRASGRQVGFFGGDVNTSDLFRFTADMLDLPLEPSHEIAPQRELIAV